MTPPRERFHGLRDRAEEYLQQGPLAGQGGRAERLLHELQVHQVELELQNQELREAEAALQESEARYRLLSDAASDCIFWTAPDGRVRYASPASLTVFGHSPAEFMEWPNLLASLIHLEDLPAYLAQSWLELEYRILHDGSERWIMCSRQLLYDETGACLGWRSSHRDITERKRAEQEISQLNQALRRELAEREAAEAALREADRQKDEFLAMLAHELRNPLVPIRNAVHVLGRAEHDEPVVNWAQQTIDGQVTHLTRLVNDLLDVARVARGKITLQYEQIDFVALAERVLEMESPLLESTGHRLAVRLPAAPVYVEVDPVRITQVLVNLLDNAIKYSPDGGTIELDVGVTDTEVSIQVRDEGIGIAAELLPRVFDLFQQGERSLDRAQGGWALA